MGHKLKNLLHLIGIKPKTKVYATQQENIKILDFGNIIFHHWLHPKARKVIFSSTAIKQLQQLIQPGQFAIDIGAHTGDTTIPIAFAAGGNGCVLALEPNRYVYSILEKNSANTLTNMAPIKPMCIAATTEDGNYTFEYSDPGYCNGGNHENISVLKHDHSFKLDVQGKNLVNLLHAQYQEWLPKLGLIKVDAEGYDFSIIKSIQPILKAHKPNLIFEVFKHTSPQSRIDIMDALQNMQYKLYDYNEYINGNG